MKEKHVKRKEGTKVKSSILGQTAGMLLPFVTKIGKFSRLLLGVSGGVETGTTKQTICFGISEARCFNVYTFKCGGIFNTYCINIIYI